MQVIVPWAELTAVVEPFYPKISEAGGRPPLPLERMLRVYSIYAHTEVAARVIGIKKAERTIARRRPRNPAAVSIRAR